MWFKLTIDCGCWWRWGGLSLFIEAQLSSEVPESSFDDVRAAPFRVVVVVVCWFTSEVGDCTLGHDKLIPKRSWLEYLRELWCNRVCSPFRRFLSCSQCSGWSSSSPPLDILRCSASSAFPFVVSLSEGSNCSLAISTICWCWLPLTSFLSSLFVVGAV